MFEVEPNLWLQGFDAPWLLGLMTLVSEVGRAWFYMPVFLVLAFGVRLRPMVAVLLALMLAGLVTDTSKHGFGLPRPSEVDARVLNKGQPDQNLVDDGGAQGFWALPSDEAIAAARARDTPEYGFVSGHTSAATALALGLALFFGGVRRRWVWCAALGWALLMGLSRMYLGRHFLGDVVGGLLVGGGAVWAAWAFVQAVEGDDPVVRRRAWGIAGGGVAALALVSPFLPAIDAGAVGEVAGALACLAVFTAWGYPEEAPGFARRLLRVLLAFVAGYGISLLLELAWDTGGWGDRHGMSFLFAAIGYPLTIVGIAAIATWLGLYRRPADAVPAAAR